MKTLALLLLLLLAAAAPAAADYPCTIISTVPIAITSPGSYCADRTLTYTATSGTAIFIAAQDVTLDLGGHSLIGSPSTSDTASGITAIGLRNVTVRNGTVVGFLFAVRVEGLGAVVEDLHVLDARYFGVWVNGTGAVIRRCQVVRVGGSTLGGAYTVAIAVKAVGPGVVVQDTTIADPYPPAGGIEAVGIHLDSAPGGVIQGNRITAAVQRPDTYAIWINGTTTRALIQGNYVARFVQAMAWAVPSPSLAGKFRDNTWIDVAVINSTGGGIDAGGNE